MTYQAVVNLIRNTALSVNPTGNFMHGRRSDSSLEYSGKLPLIHLSTIRTTVTDRVEGNYSSEIFLFFWQQDTPQTSNEEREAIISEMFTLSETFMDTLLETAGVSITGEKKTPEYRQLSGTMSGYGVTFNLLTKRICP